MTHYFCKMPGDVQRVSWHQDASYWPLTPSKVVTIWLAIDDVDEENGPHDGHSRFPPSRTDTLREQHGIRTERAGADRPTTRSNGAAIPVPFVMKAGQISMHTDLAAARV